VLRGALAFVVIAWCAGLARASDITSEWAGVYKHRFENATVDGDRYESEDVFEIVELDSDAAYVRARLAFSNGHSCSIHVVARVEGDALVYRERAPPSYRGQCVLTLRRTDTQMRFDDAEGQCTLDHCGARGSFNGSGLPTASQRRIRYMQRLLASREYAEALQEAGREP